MLTAKYRKCGLSVDMPVALHLSRTRSPLQSLDGQFRDLANVNLDNLCFSLTFETPREQSSGRLIDIIVTRRRACQNWSLRSGAERFLPDLDFFLCAILREMQIKSGERLD
jgi:hypothetical protein